MSIPEPPQPEPSSSSALPPPPPPPPPPPLGAPLGGSTVPRMMGPQQPLRGSGTAVIVLYWCVVAANVLSVVAIVNRRSVITDIIDRGTVLQSDIDADDRARGLIVAAFLLGIALQLGAVIATAIWSRKAATNAQQRGAYDVNPGKAAWGWFVPIGWYWLGFNEVRNSLQSTGRPGDAVKRWQMAFIVSSLFGWLFRNAGSADGDSAEAIRDAIGSALLPTSIAVLLLGVSAFMAMKAIREVNDALSVD